MPVESLVPEFLSTLLSWFKTLCTYLAILAIGPWVIALVYDLLLWLVRATWYEIPIVGGRARGRRPPGRPALVTEIAPNAANAVATGVEGGAEKLLRRVDETNETKEKDGDG